MKIAVLMGGLLYDSQKSLLKGITEYAEKRDINIFVFTCGGDIYTVNDHNRGEFQIYNLPNLSDYDGVIIAPNTIQNADVVKELEEKLARLHVPTIVIDSPMENQISFEVDNESALYEMAEHIVSVHEKQKILYISGPKENMESNDRRDGFLKCMQEHQLKENQDFHIYYGDFWIESGKEITKKYIEKYGTPEAVVCANDYMAIGAVETLKRKGLLVPKDVLVTGFDNSFEGRYHVPRITSVKKPMRDIGYAACRALVSGKIAEKRIRFEVDCKFSESCGCCYGKNENIRELKRRMTKEKSDNIKWSEILNSMSADLNELRTLNEFVDKLKYYVAQMKFPYFYLCLCEENHFLGELELVDGVYREVEKNLTDYTKKVKVAIAYEAGNFLAPETIATKDLLPERVWKKIKGMTAVVVPIHFRRHCMGYCVVGNSSFPMETIQFQSWIMNLGNGLENIRKQMLMQSMIEQLNKMWIYDTMTGLYNRAGFYIKAEEVIQSCKAEGKDVLLLFVDIDKLKTVNDSFGHEEGDFYIKSVAGVCQKNCGKNGIAMRYGGDEFIIFRANEKEETYQNMIEKIKTEIRAIREKEGKSYEMDASIGHYVSKVDADFKLEVLVERADKEMYEMKRKVEVR